MHSLNDYLIFHLLPKLNTLDEYCCYAIEKKEQHLCFIYIYNKNAFIQNTGSHYQNFDLLPKLIINDIIDSFETIDQLEQILQTIPQIDEQNILPNLSCDSIFFNLQTLKIYVPYFIQIQLQQSKYKKMIVEQILQEFKNLEIRKDNSTLNIYQNIPIITKILKEELDYNDQVSEKIIEIFKSLKLISINGIENIYLLKNGKIEKQKFQKIQNEYQLMKEFIENQIIKRIQVPDSDIRAIKQYMLKLNPKGREITQFCIEIEGYHQQKLRITATQMHDILKNQDKALNKSISNIAQQYGIDNEINAIKLYKAAHPDIDIMFIDVLYSKKYPFICGQPDGIVLDSNKSPVGIIEVKCSYSQRDQNLSQNMEEIAYIARDQNKQLILKKEHTYYSQIQTYLLITQLKWCDLVIFTSKGIREIRVNYDYVVIEKIIQDCTKHFFTNMIPEQCQLIKKQLDERDIRVILQN